MRTTVNLDSDVTAAVERLRADTGVGLSEAVNELARAGLSAPAPRVDYVHRSRPMGLRVDISNVAEALELLDELDGVAPGPAAS